ncbi:Pollen Ole e 1 allergen/extensin [Corchorus olitorius]|uniref:Pollen Ole e 1 allergen/extensin n=1 Tax=Corchorus olitorius TaxID=93759 RepID=A0A1R3JUR5_9ROSI|nr:Pollen Ole e 1 allergen/extensin [Corchorus olitorius]
MALKTLVFVCLLVTVMALAAVPKAEAQLGGLGGLGGLVSGLIGLLRIQGTVFCTLNGNIGINGTATPVFANALVQVQCADGNVVGSTTTNGAGVFSILLDPVLTLLQSLLNNCNLVVKTPLSTCNATLPSVGKLVSPIQFLGNTASGLLSIADLIPGGFHLLLPSNN